MVILLDVILLYIIPTPPPPGEKSPLRLGTSVGYQGIPLDPQGPKMGVAPRISGPDQRGRLRQVPGGSAREASVAQRCEFLYITILIGTYQSWEITNMQCILWKHLKKESMNVGIKIFCS